MNGRQLDLWALLPNSEPLIMPDYEAGSTIEQQFDRFHQLNPHVYESLRDMARAMKQAGHEHYGIAALFEVLRFSASMRTEGGPYKLNNNFRALYARMIMERNPDLAGFFTTRTRRQSAAEEYGYAL